MNVIINYGPESAFRAALVRATYRPVSAAFSVNDTDCDGLLGVSYYCEVTRVGLHRGLPLSLAGRDKIYVR